MKQVIFQDWSTNLQCHQCGDSLDLPQRANSPIIKCPKCQKEYNLTPNGIAYAYAASERQDFYRFTGDSNIELRYFENYPFQELEEAWQDYSGLVFTPDSRPAKLLPIVKKYHDAIKMRLRRLLEVHPGSLTNTEVDEIKKDPKSLQLNLFKLFALLKKAHPHKIAEVENFYTKNREVIEKIVWIRNKIEHISFTQWPLNSNIYTNLNKEPGDNEAGAEILNILFLKKSNTLAVDIFELAESIFGTDPNFPYWDLQQYKNAATSSYRPW